MPLDTWEKFLRDISKTLDTGLAMAAGKRVGFCLLVFPFEEAERKKAVADGLMKGADYVSNAERSGMIELLRETADRLENREDIPVAEGKA